MDLQTNSKHLAQLQTNSKHSRHCRLNRCKFVPADHFNLVQTKVNKFRSLQTKVHISH